MEIPFLLQETYKRGQVLFFIGQGISGDQWDSLRDELAAQLPNTLPTDLAIPEVAQEFESAYGTPALITRFKDFYSKNESVGLSHELLASAKLASVFVTICVDEQLERAFQQTGRRLNVVVDHIDRGYSQERDVARLFKLQGTLSRPDTLKLTARDIQQLYFESKGLSSLLRGYLAEYTNLFLGFPLDDPFFQQFYRSSIAPLDRHVRTSYVLGGPYSRGVELFCKNNQIQTIFYNPADFLSTLLFSVQEPEAAQEVLAPLAPVLLQRRPFKRLLPYELDDRDLYFGRRAEVEQLLSLIQAYRLVVLHGQSGTGKSSLLAAGVIPALAGYAYRAVLIKTQQDVPLGLQIRHGLADVAAHDSGPEPGRSLAEYLAKITTSVRPLVVIIDQFEDFFIHYSETDRKAFSDELARAVADRSLPVKWVLSLRSEWFAALSQLREEIPEIFEAELWLKPMDRDGARQAIEMPLRQVRMDIEPALVERLLHDLGPESIQLPQLQLVCDELYDRCRNQDKARLELSDYLGIGGAPVILVNYLNRFLHRFPADESRQIRSLLQALVTSYNTLAQRTLVELAEITGLSEEKVRGYIDELQDERLVLAIERVGQAVLYQLVHYYLVDTLAEDPQFLTEKAVREMLRQETVNWQRFKTLLDQDKLEFLRNQLGDLEPPETAAELLLRSVLRSGSDIHFWVDRLCGGESCHAILHEQFEPGQARYPLSALAAIARLTDPKPFEALLLEVSLDEGRELRVRQQAALRLVQLFPSDLDLLRKRTDHAAREIVTYLFQAQENGELHLQERRTWEESLRVVRARLAQNQEYILRTAVIAGMFGGGLGGFVAGLIVWLFNPAGTWYQVLISTFTSMIIGLCVLAGMSVTEAATGSQSWQVRSLGGVLGGAVSGALIGLTNVDQPGQEFVVSLILGCLTGWILVSGLSITATVAPRQRWLVRLVGLSLAGFMIGFLTEPLVTIGVQGLRSWHLGVIIAGGWAGIAVALTAASPRLAGSKATNRTNIPRRRLS